MTKINHTASHILAWHDGYRWRVQAATDRGDTFGERHTLKTPEEAQACAGRLAKQTGAGALLWCDGGTITKRKYNR